MRCIDSILKVSDQGVSRPFVCRDDDGGIRWCKGSHTGFRSLVSEWICAHLAREVGLPVPDFGIFRLDRSDFCIWRDAQNAVVPDLVTETNQYVFGSLNVENSKDVFDSQSDLAHVDRELLAKIYWFDKLIHNTDRTDFNSNLLANGSVCIIDHNNAFDPAFDRNAFSDEHILRHFRDAISTDEIRAFQARVGTLVQSSFLERAWNDMPDEWAEVGESVLSLETIDCIITEECNA